MLPRLIQASTPREQPLRCPCGGQVRLDGPGSTPGTVRYLCVGACGIVRASLAELVPAPAPT